MKRYHDEDDLDGGVTVYYRGRKYKTGNRRGFFVELYRGKKYVKTVSIRYVYSKGNK
jgi:hypothetical protein